MESLSNEQVKETGVNGMSNSVGGSNDHRENAPFICARCAKLDIRIDRFTVNAARNERTLLYGGASQPLKTSASAIHLGSLHDIHAETRCRICKLLWHAVSTSEQPDDTLDLSEYATINCFASWEVDGREVATDEQQAPQKPRNLTRRIHLRWSSDKIQDSYLVFVTPVRHTQPNSDAPRAWGREHLFLGRVRETMGKNQALINSWLESCHEKHGERCRIKHDEKFCKLTESSYFGVIDVQDMCLTELPTGQKYIALSYVWGKDKRFRTLLSNVLLHRAHGGLEANIEKMPQTVLDAFEVCRKLSVRYLWVDSLCIVQDSIRSWQLNAAAMDTVYGNAHLTICAADDLDASAGLRALHASPTDPLQNDQLIVECAPGLSLTVSWLAETGIERSVWNTRAWTFCERLLSKRCLIFTQGRVFFQCRSTAMSEDIVAEPKGAGWSLGLVQAPLQLLRQLKPDRRPFWVYMNCVELYSKRCLTYQNDVLAAFNGISNLLSDKMDCTMIFGMPSSHFDLAMLWTPTGPVTRRVPRSKEEKDRYGANEFPSWSWCGWTNASEEPQQKKVMHYCPDTLEGPLQNVNEFLTQHTWIHWYVRDGHGDLRPIWRSSSAKWLDETGRKLETESSYMTVPYRSRSIDSTSERRRKMSREDPRKLTRKRSRERKYIDSGDKDYEPDYYRSRPYVRGEGVVYERHRERYDKSWEPIEERPRTQRPQQYHPPLAKLGPRSTAGTTIVRNRWEGYTAYSMGPEYDVYGRVLKPDMAERTRTKFHRTVPEHPFGVNVAEEIFEPSVEFADQKYLQFYTWSATFRLALHEPRSKELEEGLARYDMADASGDWCGTIVLDETWAKRNVTDIALHEFLAISDAKSFTAEENDVWTYYIPIERSQSEWDLFFVLLVERGRGGIAKRVGLGKCFKNAFSNAQCSWKEIILE